MSAPIEGVEFIDGPCGNSALAVLLEYEDEIGLAVWRGVTAAGQVLEVTDHDPAVQQSVAADGGTGIRLCARSHRRIFWVAPHELGAAAERWALASH